MHDDPRDNPEVDGDSSDVVTGPIGSARFVEPTKAEALSADLDELPTVEDDDNTAPGSTQTQRS